MGLAARELGLTIDRVRSYDVVTADGHKHRVQGDDDLFWALRGGGGSFGIVTAARLKVRHVNRAAFFRITFPAGSRTEALAAWDDLAPTAPDALTAILTLTATGASAFGQFFGSESRLRTLVRPLTRVAGASLTTGTSGYLAAAAALGRLRRRRPRRLPRLQPHGVRRVVGVRLPQAVGRRPARLRRRRRHRRDADPRRLRRRDQPDRARATPPSSTATSASASRSSRTHRSPPRATASAAPAG